MKKFYWALWIIITLSISGFFVYKMMLSDDKSELLIGEATHGHYQIEMACTTCHTEAFGGEDVIQNDLDKVLGNIHLGTSPWSKSKNGFRTREGWLSFFKRHKLQLVNSISIPRATYPIYPVFREIFVLKVA